MDFIELEKKMNSKGIFSLADIARHLSTTPQAVSNWKARNQVPHHIVTKLNLIIMSSDDTSQNPDPAPAKPSSNIFEEKTISLSDILLTLAEQLKVIVLTTFISVFLTFTYVKFIEQPIYESHSTILLPQNEGNLGGLAGIASQFGVNVPNASSVDLSSPSLIPDLIKSRTFAERILDKPFYTKEFQKELSLLAIITYGEESPKLGLDTLIQKAIGKLNGMISFENSGSFSVLTVKAKSPHFARDLNKAVLNELQSLNRFFKNQNQIDKSRFIKNRIESVENDLKKSEQRLKTFREKNRQIISPALQLEQDYLSRDVEIQKDIYLTLRQQQELAKIEEVEKASIIQVLDNPQVPLGPTNKNVRLSVMLAFVLGMGLGVIIAFIRSYANNSDIDERKKLRRVKHFFKKKTKDIILDHRISGIVSLLLIIGLPYYLGYESQNPIFFGLYSAKLMLVNIVYVLTLILSLGLFIYLLRENRK